MADLTVLVCGYCGSREVTVSGEFDPNDGADWLDGIDGKRGEQCASCGPTTLMSRGDYFEAYNEDRINPGPLDLGNVGFEDLRKQKALLCSLVQELAVDRGRSPKHDPTQIDGLLGLIDRIQDESAKRVGKLLVFGEEQEDGDDA